MSRIYLPLLLVQLLLQFASVAYGSSGAGLWTSLANEVEVQGGTVTAGSEGAGVAAEGPLGPGQMRSGDVVQTAASNAEMQKTRLLQQQKRQLVDSIVSPIMSFVVLMLLYFFAYISFVGPGIERVQKEARGENIILSFDDALDKFLIKSSFATSTIVAFGCFFSHSLLNIAIALIKALLAFRPKCSATSARAAGKRS